MRAAQRRAGDGAALGQGMLADGEPESRLLLITYQWQIGVEQIMGAVLMPRFVSAPNLNHHLRIGETGHSSISPAGKFLGKKQSAIAGQDRDAALAVIARLAQG